MKMKKHNGYTLIEVLIALFIFSIASYLVSVALIENQKNSKILKVKTQRFIEVQRALTLLTQDVSQSTIYLEEDNNQTLGTFKATERELNLTRRGHINPNYISMDSSLRKIKILYEQETLYRGKSANYIKPEAFPLLKGVVSLQWTFFDEQGKFYDIWPPIPAWNNKTPSLFKMTIVLEDLGTIERVVALPGGKIQYEFSQNPET